jgi:hypothetical protein
MEFIGGLAKRISGYFSFNLSEWFGSDIPELSENFKKSLNELQEATEKLSKKLKEKSINDNEWLDNLVSRELVDHQQLALRTIELLAQETTTTTTTTTSVILKNLIDGSFLWRQINQSIAEKEAEYEISSEPDYPSEKLESILETWCTNIDLIRNKSNKLYEESKKLCQKACQDKIDQLENNKDYCQNIEQLIEQLLLYNVSCFIGQLEDCLENNEINYEQLEDKHKFREHIKSVNYKDLKEYVEKTIKHIKTKKKSEEKKNNGKPKDEKAMKKTINLEYLYKNKENQLLYFQNNNKEEQVVFHEDAFSSMSEVPWWKLGNKEFKAGKKYQLTYSELITDNKKPFVKEIKDGNIIEVAKTTSPVVSIVFPNKPKTKTSEENWKDVHIDFTLELKKKWENNGFNKSQTKEWIDIGLNPNDYDFVEWLKNTKKLTSKKVLDHHSAESLRNEFKEYVSWLKAIKENQGGILTSTFTESPTSTEFPLNFSASSTTSSGVVRRPNSEPASFRKFSEIKAPNGEEVTFEQVAPVFDEAARLHDEVIRLKSEVSNLAEKCRRKSVELRDLVRPGEATTTTTTTTTTDNNFNEDFQVILNELQNAQQILDTPWETYNNDDLTNKIYAWANFRDNYYKSIKAYNDSVNFLKIEIQKLQDENSSLHKEIVKTEELLKQKQNIEDQIEQLKKEKEAEKKKLESENNDLKAENDKAREEIKELEDKITEAKEEKNKKTKELEDQITKIEEELERYKNIDNQTIDLIEKINEELGNITKWSEEAGVRDINQTRIDFYKNVTKAARELELAVKKTENEEEIEEFDPQKLGRIQKRLNLLKRVNDITKEQGYPIFHDDGDFNDQNLNGIIELLRTNADINKLIRVLDRKIIEALEETKGDEVVLRRTISGQTTKASLEIVWENLEKLIAQQRNKELKNEGIITELKRLLDLNEDHDLQEGFLATVEGWKNNSQQIRNVLGVEEDEDWQEKLQEIRTNNLEKAKEEAIERILKILDLNEISSTELSAKLGSDW